MKLADFENTAFPFADFILYLGNVLVLASAGLDWFHNSRKDDIRICSSASPPI